MKAMLEIIGNIIVGFIIIGIFGVTFFFFIVGFLVFFFDRECVKKYREYKGWRQ